MPSDYEEKYLLLRDENTALKKKKNEQEATIKRMFTKLAMIEEALKKKRQSEESDNQQEIDTGGKAAIPVKRDLDTERFINVLKNENIALRKKAQVLQEKNRVLDETLRQLKLKPHLARSAAASKAIGAIATKKKAALPQPLNLQQQQQTKPNVSNATQSRAFDGATLDAQVSNARRLHRTAATSNDLEHALKTRLVVAEKHVVKLQRENERLRASTSQSHSNNNNNNNNELHASSDGDDGDDAHANSRHRAARTIDTAHLQHELRDRQAQLAILTARYDNLEATAAAEREIQEQTLTQMEAMNRQVHALRMQLQDATIEREAIDTRAAKALDLEKELLLVREQNRRLEDRMTSLCESPFIHDAFERKERIDKLFALEKQCDEQKHMLAHLESENQKLQALTRELQSTNKRLKHAKDVIDQELAHVRQHLNDERHARSVAAVRFATEASLPTTTATPSEPPLRTQPPREVPQSQPRIRSLALPIATATEPERRDASSSPVRLPASPTAAAAASSRPSMPSSHVVLNRRYDTHVLTVPLSLEDDTTAATNSVTHLRHRVHVLQMAHLRAMQELERCEKMLRAQTNINRELTREVEDVTARKLSASSTLQRKLKELALVADERQQRICVLEAHVRELKYARAKLRQTAQFLDAEAPASDDEDDDANTSDNESIAESLVLAARDLAPGEQLLEVRVLTGTFDRNVVSSNASTFVLSDFYDFESQTTPLVRGHRPDYSFAATFCVTIDGFFLRYVASETLVLEVHQAVRGDFHLVGRARVRLARLLQSRGVLREHALPVYAVLAPEPQPQAQLQPQALELLELLEPHSSDRVIGTLHVSLQLSCSISELWRLHLRSYPQDIQLLERAAAATTRRRVTTDNDQDGDTNRTDDHVDARREDEAMQCINQLEITVFGCRGLRSFAKKTATSDRLATRTPSAYVHYQLLGFPDAFTNIIAASAAPEFDLEVAKQSYVLEVDACLLRFLTKFRLWFTVFDDQVELNSDGNNNEEDDDGMIGRCGLLLADLADCKPVRGWFALRDRSDHAAGEISVLLQWKQPFDALAVLGYNLIDVEREYAATQQRKDDTAAVRTDAGDTPAVASTTSIEPVDLDAADEEVLTATKLPPQPLATAVAASVRPPLLQRSAATTATASTASPLPNPLASDMSAVSAMNEFERRKQAFLDRMKAIASASSKSLVYEALEHKHAQQRYQREATAAAVHSTTAPLGGAHALQMDRVAPPSTHTSGSQAIYHSAASTVQQSYRQYRAARVAHASAQQQHCNSLLDTDRQLARALQTWSTRELDALETQWIDRIESDVANAAKTQTVSRKQIGFVLAQTPQFAIEPSLLHQLLEHFAVVSSTTGARTSKIAYRALIHFICSVTTAERSTKLETQHTVVQVAKRLCLSLPHARATFKSIGDMMRSGVVSLGQFRAALTQLNILVSAKDLRMLVVLCDANGATILYRAFVRFVARWSIASQRVAHAIERCRQFGIAALRERLTLFVDSDDGTICEQDLHETLTRVRSDSVQFERQDARLLFQMIGSGGSSDAALDASTKARVAITDFVARLKLCVAHTQTNNDDDDDTSCYDIKLLRRLASNCRKLTCGSFSDVVAAFERFDWRKTGAVVLDAFVAIAQQQGFDILSTLELKQVAKCFGVKRDGRFAIDYRQFLDWTTPSPTATIDEVEHKLRAFAHAQAERSTMQQQLTHVLADWRSVFAAADVRKRGTLTRAAFRRVVQTTLQLPLSDDDVRVVLYSYDRSLDDCVDYAAFVQLNWRVTSAAPTAAGSTTTTVQAERDAAEVRALVQTLQTTFTRRNDSSSAALLECFTSAADAHSRFVDARQFKRCLAQCGVPLRPNDVQLLFDAFAIAPDRNKLDYDSFVRETLGVAGARVSRHSRHSQALTAADEAQLTAALTRALEQSHASIHAALQTFQEHCVVHRFSAVAPSIVYKLLDASGVVALVSSRAIRLLVQKFLVSSDTVRGDEDDDDATVHDRVSLRAVYSFLLEFVRTTKTSDVRSPEPIRSPRPANATTETADATALTALQQLVMSCMDAGVDVRSAFEKRDATYTGCVTAMELKQIVLGLGLSRFAHASSTTTAETVVGQLVRYFRVPDARDAVSYAAMLRCALQPLTATPRYESGWLVTTSERLRAHIRRRAGFAGALDILRSTLLYPQLDACFAHFDRTHTGVVTLDALYAGLTSLHYDVSRLQTQELLACIAVYRCAQATTFSRMEFDAFVLDPLASVVLAQLAHALRVDGHNRDDNDACPRIAQLSRALLASDSDANTGLLPAATFWRCLEDALARALPLTMKATLTHLFDVHRNAHIAFRLFMKVISQQPQQPQVIIQPPAETAAPPRTMASIPTVATRDVLRALCRQLSSLDFTAQLDLLTEHLQHADTSQNNHLASYQLERVFQDVGIVLSPRAFASLVQQFRLTNNSDSESDDCESVAVRYDKLLRAIQEQHDDRSDRSEDDDSDYQETDSRSRK